VCKMRLFFTQNAVCLQSLPQLFCKMPGLWEESGLEAPRSALATTRGHFKTLGYCWVPGNERSEGPVFGLWATAALWPRHPHDGFERPSSKAHLVGGVDG